MFDRARLLLTIACFAMPMPAAAQAPAPTVTAFDGTYVGVSYNVSSYTGIGPSRCAPAAVQAPLTITNGVVRSSQGGNLEGVVSAEGRLVTHRPNGNRIEGQIDPQGDIRAQFSTSNCLYEYVWRKQSR
jgi:hypothetical protein